MPPNLVHRWVRSQNACVTMATRPTTLFDSSPFHHVPCSPFVGTTLSSGSPAQRAVPDIGEMNPSFVVDSPQSVAGNLCSNIKIIFFLWYLKSSKTTQVQLSLGGVLGSQPVGSRFFFLQNTPGKSYDWRGTWGWTKEELTLRTAAINVVGQDWVIELI